MTIYEKLLKVQNELKAPKNQRNDFGKYNYRSCEDILESVKPLLLENGAVILLSDEVKVVGERYYIESTAKFIDVTDGTSIEVKASAREEETKKGMDGSQISGASSSYARKYALGGLLDIDDNKDSDSTNKGTTDTPPTPEQLQELEEVGGSLDKCATYYKKPADQVTSKEVQALIDRKKKLVAKTKVEKEADEVFQ